MTRIKKGILTLVSISLVLIYCLINDPSRDITLTLGLYAGSSWDVPRNLKRNTPMFMLSIKVEL